MTSQQPYYNAASGSYTQPYQSYAPENTHPNQQQYASVPPTQANSAPYAPQHSQGQSTPSYYAPPTTNAQQSSPNYYNPAPPPQFQPNQHNSYQYPNSPNNYLPSPSYNPSQYPPPHTTSTTPNSSHSSTAHQQYPPYQPVNYQASSPPALPARKPVPTSQGNNAPNITHQAPPPPPRHPSGYDQYGGSPQGSSQVNPGPGTYHQPQAQAQHNTSTAYPTYQEVTYSNTQPPPIPLRPGGLETSHYPPPPTSSNYHDSRQGLVHGGAISQSVDGVISQFNNLNIIPQARPSAPPDDDDIEFPRLVSTEPRPDGEPNEVLQECPESRQMNLKMFWYRLPKAPKSLICTYCYNKHISQTTLKGSFEKISSSNGRCRFNTTRVLLYIWPEAQRTQNLDALVEFMNRRLSIPDCKGFQGVRVGEGIKFFSPVTEPPKGFVACEACYEDNVLGSPFADKFGPTALVQKPTETWPCSFSGPFVARALRKYAKQSNGWNLWANETNKRIYMPVCDGKPCQATSRRWFRLRGGPEAFVGCEACYLDRAGLTRFAGQFELVTAAPPPGALYGCDLNIIPAVVAMNVSHGLRDLSVFRRTVQVLLAHSACTVNGSKGGTWYELRGGSPNFAICVVCYTGIIETMKAGRYFVPRTIGPDEVFACDFTAGGQMTSAYIDKLGEALDTGVWSRFSTYVRKWASIPPCPKDKLAPGIFFGFSQGFPDIAACKKCYEDVIMPSRFDSLIVHRDATQFEGNKAMCSFFSPNMRSRWQNACSSGDFNGFMEYAKARVKVWCETVPVWEALLARQKMAAQRANTAAFASVLYQGMENLQLASSATHSDRLYGNSATGWHETQNGAISAEYNQDMISGFAQAGNGNVWMTMAELEKRWRSVL